MIPKNELRSVWDILLDDEDGLDFTLFMGVPTIYNQLIEHHDTEEFQKRI